MAEASGQHPKIPLNRRWVFPAIFAGFIIWGFGYQTVWQRLTIELEGTIVSSRDVPATGTSRSATYYVVRGTDGQDQTYVAGATDASLKRSMPVGTRIRKEWGQLGYQVNDRWVEFPIAFYSGILGVAAAFAVAAIAAWWRER